MIFQKISSQYAHLCHIKFSDTAVLGTGAFPKPVYTCGTLSSAIKIRSLIFNDF